MCVLVRYWRGAEREEQFMVCQRMSEKKLGHDEENQWRRFLSEAAAVWGFFLLLWKEIQSWMDQPQEKTRNVTVAALEKDGGR